MSKYLTTTSEPYYRIMLDYDDTLKLIQLTKEQEALYDKTRWLTARQFSSEDSAIAFVRSRLRDAYIPLYVREALEDFLKNSIENCLDA